MGQGVDKVALRFRVDPWYRHCLDTLPTDIEAVPVVNENQTALDVAISAATSERPLPRHDRHPFAAALCAFIGWLSHPRWTASTGVVTHTMPVGDFERPYPFHMAGVLVD